VSGRGLLFPDSFFFSLSKYPSGYAHLLCSVALSFYSLFAVACLFCSLVSMIKCQILPRKICIYRRIYDLIRITSILNFDLFHTSFSQSIKVCFIQCLHFCISLSSIQAPHSLACLCDGSLCNAVVCSSTFTQTTSQGRTSLSSQLKLIRIRFSFQCNVNWYDGVSTQGRI
jgi:hypothetical protein